MDDNERLTALNRSLTNQPPSGQQINRIEMLRESGKELGEAIVRLSRDSRERSLALTHLEETVMWAVKGIVLEDEDGG